MSSLSNRTRRKSMVKLAEDLEATRHVKPVITYHEEMTEDGLAVVKYTSYVWPRVEA